MELTTDEIIARLMNLSVKLDGEMRFEESSVISQAIALIMTMRNATERMRHPSMSYNEELKAVIEWITENPS
jgi:AmiR/NasT family two-component response regulator